MATGRDHSSQEGSHSSHRSHRSRDICRRDRLISIDEEDEVLRSDYDYNPNELECMNASSTPISPIDPMIVKLPHYISCERDEGISIPSDTMDPYLLGRLKHESLLSFLRQGFGVDVRHNERKDNLIRQIVRINVNRLRHHQSRDKQRIEDLEMQTDRLSELLVSVLADKHQGGRGDSERPRKDREDEQRSKQHHSRSIHKTSYERSSDSHTRSSDRHSSDNNRVMSVSVSSASKTSHSECRSQREVDANIADLQQAISTIPQKADVPGFMDDLASLFQQTGIPQVERNRQVVEMINKTAQMRVQSENLVSVIAEVRVTQSEPSRCEDRRPGTHVAGRMHGMLKAQSKKMRKPFTTTTVTTVQSVVTNINASTVSTKSVVGSIPVTVPLHSTAVRKTTGFLPNAPIFDVTELPSTPFSDHEVLPLGLVRNKSRVTDHHRLDQDRSVRNSRRSRHRRNGRHLRDTTAYETGIVPRSGMLPLDVEPSNSSSSSNSSSNSSESDDSEITLDYTYVPPNERSRLTSKQGSDSFSNYSGLEHESCQFVSDHSRRSHGRRHESFTGSRKLHKMLKAAAQLQNRLQMQIQALIDQTPHSEPYGPFHWKDPKNDTKHNSVLEASVDDSKLSMVSMSQAKALKTKGKAKKAKGRKNRVSSTNKDVYTSSRSRKDKMKDTWFCGMCQAEHPKGPNTCPHPDRKRQTAKTSSKPLPIKEVGKSKGRDIAPAAARDKDGEEVSFNQLAIHCETEESSESSS